MPNLYNPDHFLPQNEILVVSGTHSLRDVYAKLPTGSSGVVITDQGAPRYYLKAAEFIQNLSASFVNGRMPPGLFDTQISQVANLIPDMPSALVPIETTSAAAWSDSLLGGQADRVYYISDGQPKGFVFNREFLRATATRKIVYRCQNGHENSDPDHGTCYFCPMPVQPVVKP